MPLVINVLGGKTHRQTDTHTHTHTHTHTDVQTKAISRNQMRGHSDNTNTLDIKNKKYTYLLKPMLILMLRYVINNNST